MFQAQSRMFAAKPLAILATRGASHEILGPPFALWPDVSRSFAVQVKKVRHCHKKRWLQFNRPVEPMRLGN